MRRLLGMPTAVISTHHRCRPKYRILRGRRDHWLSSGAQSHHFGVSDSIESDYVVNFAPSLDWARQYGNGDENAVCGLPEGPETPK